MLLRTILLQYTPRPVWHISCVKVRISSTKCMFVNVVLAVLIALLYCFVFCCIVHTQPLLYCLFWPFPRTPHQNIYSTPGIFTPLWSIWTTRCELVLCLLCIILFILFCIVLLHCSHWIIIVLVASPYSTQKYSTPK